MPLVSSVARCMIKHGWAGGCVQKVVGDLQAVNFPQKPDTLTGSCEVKRAMSFENFLVFGCFGVSFAASNRCHASSNKCLTSSIKKLLEALVSLSMLFQVLCKFAQLHLCLCGCSGARSPPEPKVHVDWANMSHRAPVPCLAGAIAGVSQISEALSLEWKRRIQCCQYLWFQEWQ